MENGMYHYKWGYGDNRHSLPPYNLINLPSDRLAEIKGRQM